MRRSLKEALRAEGVAAGDAAVALAELKAERVASRRPDAIVLGADQILTCEGAGSTSRRPRRGPRPAERARRQVARAGDRGGRLPRRARVWHHLAVPRLWLRACSPEFLDAYLDAVGDAAFASVGAYQIEGLGAQLFARIEGDHFAVLGLPLLPLLEFLREQGVLLR